MDERHVVPIIPRDLALYALGNIAGVGHSTAVQLYDTVNFDSLFTASRGEVEWIAGTAHVAKPHAFADKFMANREAALEHADIELRGYRAASSLDLILDNDPRYPARLRDLSDRPRWLFVRGNIALLNSRRLITVVGTRQPSNSGSELASRVTSVLVDRGFAPVSGLAEGIDEVVHRTCVDRKGQTIAVLGTGIFNDFPATTAYLRNRILQYGGAIITEFFPKEQYSRQRFVQRNRIQAGLSSVTIPVEAAVPSGTLHTIRFALKYGRQVLGVRWDDAPESDLLRLLRAENAEIVAVPTSDDPFLSAIGRTYDYEGFARESQLARRNTQIERVVKFARQVIASESLTPIEVERMVKAIKQEHE